MLRESDRVARAIYWRGSIRKEAAPGGSQAGLFDFLDEKCLNRFPEVFEGRVPAIKPLQVITEVMLDACQDFFRCGGILYAILFRDPQNAEKISLKILRVSSRTDEQLWWRCLRQRYRGSSLPESTR